MDIVNLGPAAQQLAELIVRVDDSDLVKPTPCPAYTVGDLADHIGGLALGFTAAAEKDSVRYAGATGPAGDASRLGADWRTRIPRDLAALAQAWQEPAAWQGMTSIIGMDMPAEAAGLGAVDELVVHGWDLARATGMPFACDQAALAAAQSFLAQFASPDAPAGPQVPFGPSRPLPGDAPLLDRVIALAGRDPSWSSL